MKGNWEKSEKNFAHSTDFFSFVGSWCFSHVFVEFLCFHFYCESCAIYVLFTLIRVFSFFFMRASQKHLWMFVRNHSHCSKQHLRDVIRMNRCVVLPHKNATWNCLHHFCQQLPALTHQIYKGVEFNQYFVLKASNYWWHLHKMCWILS